VINRLDKFESNKYSSTPAFLLQGTDNHAYSSNAMLGTVLSDAVKPSAVSVVDKPATSSGLQWSTVAGEGDWHVVTKKPRQAVKVKGTCGNATIKAVPRKNILAAFVGRLDQDTDEDDLRTFLVDAGLVDVKCKKLKVKEGMKFNTAAFFVSCSSDCKDKLYDSSIWPDGAELRDWVFY
jgi:hypothetical protein